MSQMIPLHRTVKLLSVALLVVTIGGCDGDTEISPDTSQETAEAMGDAERPPVVVTLSNGRSVWFGESGVFEEEEGVHPGPAGAMSFDGNRASLRVGPNAQEITEVSMKADSLIFIHVDASVEDEKTILVYGTYEPGIPGLIESSSSTSKAALFSLESTEATKAGWECKWCRGDVLACGVNPNC